MAQAGKNNLGISVAIVIAGALIALALFLSGNVATGGNATSGHSNDSASVGAQFRLPNETDHVRGNPDAHVAIIEFSDFECPFCARLHPTLERIVEESPDVKWIYRHFPLSSIHSRALGASVASECIAKLGGNDAFWDFADTAFGSQNALGDALYRSVVERAGIDEAAYRSCLSDHAISSLVSEDGDEAIQAGGRGTPFAVVVTASGRLVPFSGALPYEQVRGLIDQALIN